MAIGMEKFIRFLQEHEDWLMERILFYAHRQSYTPYTSTLKEAWRLSISGLTDSFVKGIEKSPELPEFSPEFDFNNNPIAGFGVKEAKLHRERGISLSMFLGLFKYYRSCYLDLLELWDLAEPSKHFLHDYTNRLFDIIEISFCTEWAGGETDVAIKTMQKNNRDMTNEKNKYLTIFESISTPVLLINSKGFIENINHSAALYLNNESTPGNYYYSSFDEPDKDQVIHYSELLPWLTEEIDQCLQGANEQTSFYKTVSHKERDDFFKISFSAMLDVSHKFEGLVVILEDVTIQKNNENKLKSYSQNLEKLVDERTKELRQSQESTMLQEKLAAIGQLAGSVAHDIRNPLGSINNSIPESVK